jgi:hypothetical protein
MSKVANNFKRNLGPVVEKIEKEYPAETTSSIKPLAELLVRWYNRRLAELEANNFNADSRKHKEEESL